MSNLIERLRKRAKEDQTCADNSSVIVDALAGQMKLFEDREGGGWNTYAVRMAVDHRNSVRRDTQYAKDLTEAADHIASLEAALAEAREALKPFAEASRRFEAAGRGFGVKPRPDSYVPRTDFTHGELRRAARALDGGEGR